MKPASAGSRLAASLGLAAILLVSVAASPPSPPPPVQLVESRPIESSLGDPSLPLARDVWVEMIRGARSNLDLEQFYLSTWPGEPMEPVLDAIGEAAARGVRVRLILDARMYDTYPRTADSLGTIPGITVHRIDMGKLSGGGVQHSKYFLVDGREMFLGSQNFDWRALAHIHEMGLRIRDRAAVSWFQEVFEMDWLASDLVAAPRAPADTSRGGRRGRAVIDSVRVQRARPTLHPARSPLPIRIVQAQGDTVVLWPGYAPLNFIPDSTQWDRDRIVRLLDSARHEATVQVLTYGRGADDESLDDALRRAAARGVRVRLLASDWMAGRAGMADLESLAVHGVEVRLSVVPEWSGGYIPFARVEHCKFAVVDSARMWLGTSNWEPSYFNRSRNLGVSLENRKLALTVRRVFETSWSAPNAIPVTLGARPAERIHGEDAPPGKKKYGG